MSSAARQATQSLQSPWSDVLDALELRPENDVALLSVEPSATKRTLLLTAESRDIPAMLEHLVMLQNDARLKDVALVAHQRQAQAPGTPMRYQIKATW